MNWQLVSDPEDMLNRGSLKTNVKMESDGKTITTQYEQDEDYIREMLEVNVALQNADRRSTSLWDNRNLVHVARIPRNSFSGGSSRKASISTAAPRKTALGSSRS